MAQAGRRASVLGDRLWDSAGHLWTGTLGQWADADEVTALLASGSPVVAHGFDRPFRELTSAEAHAYWQRRRPFLQQPGVNGAERDAEGLTYAAQVWRKDGATLLAFVEFC